METKTGFFQDADGNDSSTRLLGFIVIIVSLLFVGLILVAGIIEGTSILLTAIAAGTLFTTIAAPVLLYLFNNKKAELNKPTI